MNCVKTFEREKHKPSNRKTDEELKEYSALRHSCNYDSGRTIDIAQGYKFSQCLCNYIHPEIGRYMTFNKSYEKGRPLYSSNLTDEPNKIIETMDLIDGLKGDLQQHRHKEMMEKSKKNGNR